MSALLDVALVLVLLAFLVGGYRRGLIRSIGALIGIAAGAVAATLVSPLVTTLAPDATTRVIATIVVACVLVLVGRAIGAGIGRLLGRQVRRTPLGVIDRILGAGVNVAVAALVISVIAASVSALGVPFLAQPIAASAVLRTVNAATPAPLSTALAQLRTTVIQDGLPQITQIVAGTAGTHTVPNVTTDTPALTAAAKSVVKVTGTAYACGQDQSGSGFVVAPHRVLTNAHVLTGVSDPVVLTADGTAFIGTIVAFDVHRDLALISVPGLSAKALPVSGALADGATGVVDGYPFGGPFATNGALAVSTDTSSITDIAGGGSTRRSVTTVASDVEEGNSGGPLLTTTGAVAGIVFAKSGTEADVGYAMAPTEFRALAAKASTLTRTVSSGACTKG